MKNYKEHLDIENRTPDKLGEKFEIPVRESSPQEMIENIKLENYIITKTKWIKKIL